MPTHIHIRFYNTQSGIRRGTIEEMPHTKWNIIITTHNIDSLAHT